MIHGDVFCPSDERSTALPKIKLINSSSSVKTLFVINFYQKNIYN